MKKVKVGIIGCGNISDIYLKNTTGVFDILDVAGCADLDMDKAQSQGDKYKVKAMTVDEMLADETIDMILNLTTPQAHKIVAEQALKAGKHVYNEKPLVLSREDGQYLLDLAKSKGLNVGCAPDTFLGAGIQTCRKLIDDGVIGEPIAATAFMVCHGHESWHPAPEFYYKAGGGPMFDMGPYYITALVNLMGPVKQVTGYTRKTFAERTITSEPKNGTKIEVEVPTHVAGMMAFENGAIGTIITSFDVWGAQLPRIEIYGTKGSLSVPDPNGFGGTVELKLPSDKEWKEVPLTHDYADNNRGLGLADMAMAIIEKREPKASGALAYHVLDIMHGFHDASDAEKHVTLKSICKQPQPLPAIE